MKWNCNIYNPCPSHKHFDNIIYHLEYICTSTKYKFVDVEKLLDIERYGYIRYGHIENVDEPSLSFNIEWCILNDVATLYTTVMGEQCNACKI